MTDREAISALEMENDLILFNPMTGESIPYDSLVDINRACYDAHIIAISALQEREERSKGCNACKNFKYGEFGALGVDFNYCPLCGRPLKGAD